MNPELETAYRQVLQEESDIRGLLEVLLQYATTCLRITEFGTRSGISATAFLYAQPKGLTCYDLEMQPVVAERLTRLATLAAVSFQAIQGDTRLVVIAETDLLFIDTLHTEAQLAAELARHADKVRKFIVLHDTVTFGEQGELPGQRGLWPAIIAFLRGNEAWGLREQLIRNNGLTVLARR